MTINELREELYKRLDSNEQSLNRAKELASYTNGKIDFIKYLLRILQEEQEGTEK